MRMLGIVQGMHWEVQPTTRNREIGQGVPTQSPPAPILVWRSPVLAPGIFLSLRFELALASVLTTANAFALSRQKNGRTGVRPKK
jgi:hypothetical protein